MHPLSKRQHGGSLIVTLIVLAILGIGGFIGFQYVPQYMEAKQIDSTLESVKEAYERKPVDSVELVHGLITKSLTVNNARELGELFEVDKRGGNFVISVKYERELNLLYEKKVMPYEKELVLKQ